MCHTRYIILVLALATLTACSHSKRNISKASAPASPTGPLGLWEQGYGDLLGSVAVFYKHMGRFPTGIDELKHFVASKKPATAGADVLSHYKDLSVQRDGSKLTLTFSDLFWTNITVTTTISNFTQFVNKLPAGGN